MWVTDMLCNHGANMHCVYRHQARIGDCPRKPGVVSEDQQAQNPIYGYPCGTQKKTSSPRKLLSPTHCRELFLETFHSWSKRETRHWRPTLLHKEAALQHPEALKQCLALTTVVLLGVGGFVWLKPASSDSILFRQRGSIAEGPKPQRLASNSFRSPII